MTTTTPILALSDVLTLLRFNIRNRLTHDFVDKDQVIDLMIMSVITREHLLLIGPPGTAKSELIKRFITLLGANTNRGEFFEYLLTRFTEPNELFGPVNIQAFQQGTFTRTIERAMPTARIAFLDEIFKANSAILNALLTMLNERVFFNGLEQLSVPLMTLFAASNHVPEENSELAALFDRFLLRVHTNTVERPRMRELLSAGWNMERERIRLGRTEEVIPVFDSLEHLTVAYQALETIHLEPVLDDYRDVIDQIRSEGIHISDRRAVKMLKLVAAAALLRGGQHASSADLWVLLHCWNDPLQITTLHAIVLPVIERAGGTTFIRAERTLDELAADIAYVAQRVTDRDDHHRVYTSTYYGALLHDIERIRREIYDHSARLHADEGNALAAQRHDLLTTVEGLTDTLLDTLAHYEQL